MKHLRSSVVAVFAVATIVASSANASPTTPPDTSGNLLGGLLNVLRVAAVSGLVATPVSVMLQGPALGAVLLPVLTTVAITPSVADDGAGPVAEFMDRFLGGRSWHMFRASTRLWLG